MTSSWKVKLPAGIAIVALAAYVVFLEVQASQDSDDRFSSLAVWNAGERALQQIKDACKNSGTEDAGQCFIDHMADAGAPPEAIEFTQEYAFEHTDSIAILTDFHPQDAVDLGHVYFPQDNRRSLVLLNGSPEIVDASDLKTISPQQIVDDPHYSALRSAHPRISFFAEDNNRQAGNFPAVQRLTGSGQRFVVDYSLRDGCGSCTIVGHAEIAFDFDAAGEFQGTRVIKVEPTGPSAGEK